MDRDTFLAMLKSLPSEERAKVLDVVRALYEIKTKHRDEGWVYPKPKNCGLVWPPSPPVDPSTYTPPPSPDSRRKGIAVHLNTSQRMGSVLAVAWALFVGDAYPQQPSPAPAARTGPPMETAARPAHNPAGDERGTKAAPVAVELTNTGKSAEERQHEAEAEDAKADREHTLNILTGIAAGATTLLVVVTGALAYFTLMLWRSTGRLVRDAEETAKSELRAYVGISDVQIIHVIDQHGSRIAGYRGTVIWKNTGKTPTRRARTNVNYRLLKRGEMLPSDFAFPDGDDTRSLVLMPEAAVASRPLDLDLSEVEFIIAGDLDLYVWGWIEYDDVFAGTPRHRTEFAHRILIRGAARAVPPQPLLWEMNPLQRHNAADEECERRPNDLRATPAPGPVSEAQGRLRT